MCNIFNENLHASQADYIKIKNTEMKISKMVSYSIKISQNCTCIQEQDWKNLGLLEKVFFIVQWRPDKIALPIMSPPQYEIKYNL